MVYFKEVLIKQAKVLLDLRSTKDDEKATEDIKQIDFMVAKRENSLEYLNDARKLDEKIKREYPIILKLINIANCLPSLTSHTNTKKDDVYVIVENLKADEYGVLLDVLIKHNIISDAKDFIDKVV